VRIRKYSVNETGKKQLKASHISIKNEKYPED
jgi:hypothetical protein